MKEMESRKEELLYIYKKLLELHKISKEEYRRAVKKITEGNY